MNLQFSNLMSDHSFSDTLDEYPDVRSWLTNRLTSYRDSDKKYTLEIMCDPWSNTEEQSYVWGITYVMTDADGDPNQGNERHHVINGGLIYRAESDSYSSHT